MAFIAWTPAPGRAIDIADALGGEARTFQSLGIVDKRLVPLRYLVDAVLTSWYLVTRRPRALIVTHPPLFPALIGYAYARVARTPFVLDSHPTAFGLARDRLSECLLPVHRWLARRVRAVLVTGDELRDIAESWGARAVVVHEPPANRGHASGPPTRERPLILFPGRFAGDEPVAEVIEAARMVPQVDVNMTGDLRLCPRELREGAPSNVAFLGLLSLNDFADAIRGADAVLSLSTESSSVMRTAYEAVYAERPLVTFDRPTLRELFPYAIHVSIDAGGIATGLRAVEQRGEALLSTAPQARVLQEDRWQAQLLTLRSLIAPR